MSHCVFNNGECDGRLEWHHAIKQQRIKREFKYGALHNGDLATPEWVPASRHDPVSATDAYGLTLDHILGDPRNRVWLCSHHHELVTNGRLDVELPESVWVFARKFGLAAQLENDLARRGAA